MRLAWLRSIVQRAQLVGVKLRRAVVDAEGLSELRADVGALGLQMVDEPQDLGEAEMIVCGLPVVLTDEPDPHGEGVTEWIETDPVVLYEGTEEKSR
jgi:hypothetical protein